MSWQAFTVAAEADVSVNGARILLLVGEAPMLLSALSKSLGIVPASVANLVNRMEGMGLLETVPATDARARPVQATAEGMKLRTRLLEA